MSTYELTTPRLRLRPITPTDADALHRLWTAPPVRRFLWDDEIIPATQTADIIATSQSLFRRHGYGIWGVWRRDRDPLAGFGGYWHFHEPPQLELVLGLAESHWGRGLATEAGHALIRYGSDVLGFEVIRGSTDAPNTASIRLMERLGMTFERRATVGGLDTLFYSWGRR